MKVLNFIFIVIIIVLFSGCALTDFAKDYFIDAVDVNEYEYARDVDNEICKPEVLLRLKKTRSKEWYDATIADCKKRAKEAGTALE